MRVYICTKVFVIKQNYKQYVSVALFDDTATYSNCSGDQVKKNKAGLSCSMYGGDENYTHGFREKTAGKEPRWKIK
jgi:hypothetical protein